jgi:hypothetical protein
MKGDSHDTQCEMTGDQGVAAVLRAWQFYRSFSWDAVVAAWRYLDFQFSNHGSTLAMNGPAIGVGFRW